MKNEKPKLAQYESQPVAFLTQHGKERVVGPILQDGLPLLVHAETTDASIDIFDREALIIDRELAPVLLRFPGLRVMIEHVTIRQAIQFVCDAGPMVGATITVHHLLLNRNSLLEGGLRPHYYCRPVLRREPLRQTLVDVAISGHSSN